MSRIRFMPLARIALVVLAFFAASSAVFGQGGFVGPSNGGPSTGSVNASETQLIYNGATYAIVNGKTTFPDCTVYIALRSGLLIPAGMAAGCTPSGGRTTPTITWATPASVTAGTALSATQLNATASVAGTFAYSPAAGTVLTAGTQTLSTTFTPTDSTSYTSATATVTIVVTASGGGGFVGPGNGGPATGSVNGTETLLTYDGATYPMSNGKVTFPDCTIYIALRSGLLLRAGTAANCNPLAAPTITWANPASVLTGTVLGATQLNATASVAGTFVYSPAAGTVLTTGTQILSTTFTPTDTATYSAATKSVTIVVVAGPTTPTISWSNPVSVGAGTVLGGTQLNATASVAGTFVYSPAAGTVLTTGTQTLSTVFSPTDTTSYTTAARSVTIVVTSGPTTPSISWANPASVVTGTVLGATQLNATANVPGSFVYSPAAGTTLTLGTQTLSTTFTPTDLISYTTATKSVTITVITPTTPTITWANPASVTAGTALSGTQLNATASAGATAVAGAFVYTPAAGTVLTAGTQTLSTTFTPTDLTNYTVATKSVSIVVTAVSGASFAGPANGGPAAGVTVGTTLYYNGGVFTIVNGRVTMPDCSSYIAASNGVLIPVGMASPCTPGATKVTPALTWPTPTAVATGTALSATQLNATTSIPGALVYTPPAGTVPADGIVTLSVLFTPSDGNVYTTATATVSLKVGVVQSTLGPSNGGPTTGTVSGNVLTYNGSTYTMNAASQVQLPDCKVYLVIANGLYLVYQRDASSCGSSGGGGGSGGGGPIPGGGPIQTWSAPKLAVSIGHVSIYAVEAAYDVSTKRFLLAWRASSGACGGYDAIWGQFLDSNADPLPSSATNKGPFLISIGNNCVWAFSGWEPAVAATGDGRFMVTYAMNNLAGGSSAPYNVVGHMVEYNDGVAQLGSPITLDTNTSHEATAVGWMANARQFMVMWSKVGPPRNVKNIYGVAVTRDGVPAQIYKVSDNPDFIDLAAVKFAQGGDNNVMVVAWRDSTNSVMKSNGGISYTQVNENGSPMINTGNIVGPSSSFYRYPRIAYNSQTQKYMSIYTDYAYPGCNAGDVGGGDIMSRSFDLKGTPVESQSNVLLGTNRCNGSTGDDQFTELGLAYEPVNNAFVIGARGQDGGGVNLPVYHMVTDPSGKVYQSSINSTPSFNQSGSPVPNMVADGTGRVLMIYRPDYVSIWTMWGSK